MTETDIPPGGEGIIEVTFDTGRKKGKLKKTITVESNDPAKPKATLHVSALIEVEFGFEAHSLDMGRIHKGESSTKTAVLLFKDSSKRDLLELSSSKDHIVTRSTGSSSDNESRIDVEVTVGPDTPPGRLNETITAKLSDGSYPAASLRIAGIVVGNVEVSPETMRFTVDTSRTAANQSEQRVRVVSTQDGALLRLLSVEDTKKLLVIEVDTTVPGDQYVISARPSDDALVLKRNTSGEIKIQTDDPDQPDMRIRYSIVFPRR